MLNVRLIRLLLKSQPFRLLLSLSAISAMLAVLVSMSATSLLLTNEQKAEESLGEAAALIDPFSAKSAKPGQLPAKFNWPGSVEPGMTIQPVLSANFEVLDAGILQRVRYVEAELPSNAFAGNTELSSGAWPKIAWECAISGGFSLPLKPPVGNWSIQITGKIFRYLYA